MNPEAFSDDALNSEGQGGGCKAGWEGHNLITGKLDQG